MFDATPYRGKVVSGAHRRKDPVTYTIIDIEETKRYGIMDATVVLFSHPKIFLSDFIKDKIHHKSVDLFKSFPSTYIRRLVAAKTSNKECILELCNDPARIVCQRAIRRLKWSTDEFLIRKFIAEGGVSIRRAALSRIPIKELIQFRNDWSNTIRAYIVRRVSKEDLVHFENDISYTVKQIIRMRKQYNY